MDWEVQVQTPSGQIKTVCVYNYNYASDAKEAALSQTGASRVIYASCFDSVNRSSRKQIYQEEYDYFYEDEDDNEEEDSTPEEKELDKAFNIFISICLLIFILTITSPILAIIFAAYILYRFRNT